MKFEKQIILVNNVHFFDLQEVTMETRCSERGLISNLTATWPWFGGWGLCGSCEKDREEKELSLLQGGRVNCK